MKALIRITTKKMKKKPADSVFIANRRSNIMKKTILILIGALIMSNETTFSAETKIPNLPKEKGLYAIFDTSMGQIICKKCGFV